MRTTVNRSELIGALKDVKPAIHPKTTLPVLANVLCNVRGKRLGLEITATNLDVRLTERVHTDSSDGVELGAITAPHKRLLSFLGKVGDVETVTLWTEDESKDEINLQAGPTRTKWACFPAEEYPNSSPMPKIGAEIGAQALVDLAERVLYSVSHDKTRPSLNGVYLELAGGQATATATDGHRLATTVLQASANGLAGTSIILAPLALKVAAARAKAVVKAAAKAEIASPMVQIGFNGGPAPGRVGLKIGDSIIMARVLEGSYPDYRGVIPPKSAVSGLVEFDRAALTAAVQRIGSLSDEFAHQVRLEIGSRACKVSASTPDVGEAWEYVECESSVKDFVVGYDATIMLSVIEHLPDSERVRFGLTSEIGAAIVDSVGAEGTRALLMPLRLSS